MSPLEGTALCCCRRPHNRRESHDEHAIPPSGVVPHVLPRARLDGVKELPFPHDSKRIYGNVRMQHQELTIEGDSPTGIIAFLTNFSNTADDAGLTAQEAYVALTHFLRGVALKQFKTTFPAAQGRAMTISNCSSACTFLLRYFSSNRNIRAAQDSLRRICKEPKKEKDARTACCADVSLPYGIVRIIHRNDPGSYPFSFARTIVIVSSSSRISFRTSCS